MKSFIKLCYKNHCGLLKPGLYYRNGFHYIRIFSKMKLNDWKKPKSLKALSKRWYDRITNLHINYRTTGEYDALYYCRVGNERDGTFIALRNDDECMLRNYMKPILTEQYFSNRNTLSKIFHLPRVNKMTCWAMQEQFISGAPITYPELISRPETVEEIFRKLIEYIKSEFVFSPDFDDLSHNHIYKSIISTRMMSHGDLRCHNIIQTPEKYYVIDVDPTTLKERFLLFDLLTLITDGGQSMHWVYNNTFDDFFCKAFSLGEKHVFDIPQKLKMKLHLYFAANLEFK